MDIAIDPNVCAYICWTLNIITVTVGASTIVGYFWKGTAS